jgi:hypothetical protein
LKGGDLNDDLFKINDSKTEEELLDGINREDL